MRETYALFNLMSLNVTLQKISSSSLFSRTFSLKLQLGATGHVSVQVGRVIHVKGVFNKFIAYQAFNRFLAGEVKKNSWMI
jgi:nucleoside permease NupC